ncbi:reverse transcriptase domain-containing protein [Tanacetum coccineum]
MAPNKRTTRASPVTTTTTPTPVTNAQLKALINQGVADALAARNADRSMNGDDNHNLVTGVRRQAALAHDNCTVENQIKFATCTLLGSVLTWWNAYIRTVGHDIAYAMTSTNLKNIMTDKYCPMGEIKKLEVDMLKLKSPDNQEYVGGFARHDSRKCFGERKEYGGTLPLCNKCKFHHNGQCTIKCADCNRVGHLTQDCRSLATTNNQRNLTCYKCRNQGYYKSDCPELKNQNYKNQAEGTEAHGMFTPQKHYRLPHLGQGILSPALAIYASQPTTLPSAFSTMMLHDPTWNMDTGATSHLNSNAHNLSTLFNSRLYPSIHVGDGFPGSSYPPSM